MRIGMIRNTVLAGLVAMTTSCQKVVPENAKWATKIAETAETVTHSITTKAADSICFKEFQVHLPDTANIKKATLFEPKNQGFLGKDLVIRAEYKPEKLSEYATNKKNIYYIQEHNDNILNKRRMDIDSMKSVEPSNVYDEVVYSHRFGEVPYGIREFTIPPQQGAGKSSPQKIYEDFGELRRIGPSSKELSPSEFEKSKKEFYSVPTFE